jgi:hypothetical protein
MRKGRRLPPKSKEGQATPADGKKAWLALSDELDALPAEARNLQNAVLRLKAQGLKASNTTFHRWLKNNFGDGHDILEGVERQHADLSKRKTPDLVELEIRETLMTRIVILRELAKAAGDLMEDGAVVVKILYALRSEDGSPVLEYAKPKSMDNPFGYTTTDGATLIEAKAVERSAVGQAIDAFKMRNKNGAGAP